MSRFFRETLFKHNDEPSLLDYHFRVQSWQQRECCELKPLNKKEHTNCGDKQNNKTHFGKQNTKRQVNEFCFPKCVLLSCLSPQFVCYFLLSYDDPKKKMPLNSLSSLSLMVTISFRLQRAWQLVRFCLESYFFSLPLFITNWKQLFPWT